MNIKINLSKEEAVKIYQFLFATSKEGIIITSAGCTFMQDLLYPLRRHEDNGYAAGCEWLFSASGVLWFLGTVKRARIGDRSIVITQVTRRLKNAYMALIDELVTNPSEGDDNA